MTTRSIGREPNHDMVLSRKSKTRRIVGTASAIGVGIVAVWAAAGYSKEPPPASRSAPGVAVEGNSIALTPDAPQWKTIKLATVVPSGKHWSDSVPARVRVDETRAARVGAPLSGRVTAVFVEVGQEVKAGDKLFAVASADIADLRADRMKTEVDLEVARASLERIKALVAAQAAAGKDQLAAEAQAKQAELAVRLADAKIASLKISSPADNEFFVTAPRDGVIVEKHVLPAEQIRRDGDSLLMIADLSMVWVVAEVFETDSVGLTVGTPCKITLPSRPDLALEAKVHSISSVVDPERHTVAVRVVVPNADGTMRPNVYSQMRCALEPPPGMVEVPASAVVSNGAVQYVYVQEQSGHFVRRAIVAGSVREGTLPVSGGLKAGDVIVEQGAILLDNQIELSN
jgi:RND family efflux transporter MFP subunit